MPRLPYVALVAALALSIWWLPAGAHAIGGRLDPTPPLPEGARASNMAFVGSLAIPGVVHGDVWAHRGFAYVGTWRQPNCPANGVKIVDISNPSAPALVGALAQHEGTSQEDFTVIAAESPTFQGDLLAVGLQTCGVSGLTGVEFWDVSNPRLPRQLSFLATPNTGGVHELTLVQRPSDGKILALLAVPHSEDSGAGGDIRIVDATDPRNPVQLSSWGVRSIGLTNPGGLGQDARYYGHSVATNAGGTRAYLSYWDAGFIILDIADAAHPLFLGRGPEYLPDDEGNAHSVALSEDGRLLVGAEEDTSTTVEGITLNAPATLAGNIESAEGLVSQPLGLSGPISGDLAYLGRACPAGDPPNGVPGGDPLLADPSGKIALIDRGECLFALKLRRAAQAGAIGAIVVNNAGGPPIAMGGPMDITPPSIPAVMIRQDDGLRIKTALSAGAVNATLSRGVIATYTDWGYLRLFDISDPAHPVQVGRFGTAETFTDRVGGPPDNGRYSAHNPVLDGTLLFASWYSDGVRAIDLRDPANPVEVGYFIPPDTGSLAAEVSDRPEVWGVVKYGDLLLLSDMNYGLWILRYPELVEAGHTDPLARAPNP